LHSTPTMPVLDSRFDSPTRAIAQKPLFRALPDVKQQRPYIALLSPDTRCPFQHYGGAIAGSCVGASVFLSYLVVALASPPSSHSHSTPPIRSVLFSGAGMIIIGAIAIKYGKWQRLVYGTDYKGMVCGADEGR
jgi:hypothetical protein